MTTFVVSLPIELEEALVCVSGEWRECRVVASVFVKYTPRRRARYADAPDDPESVELMSLGSIESVEWEGGRLSRGDSQIYGGGDSVGVLRDSIEAIITADERWLLRLVDTHRNRLAVLGCD